MKNRCPFFTFPFSNTSGIQRKPHQNGKIGQFGIQAVTQSEKCNTFENPRTALPVGVFRRIRACTEYAFILLKIPPLKNCPNCRNSDFSHLATSLHVSIFLWFRITFPTSPLKANTGRMWRKHPRNSLLNHFAVYYFKIALGI